MFQKRKKNLMMISKRPKKRWKKSGKIKWYQAAHRILFPKEEVDALKHKSESTYTSPSHDYLHLGAILSSLFVFYLVFVSFYFTKNGGFFVFKREVFDYLSTADDCILEKKPLETLVKKDSLMMHSHSDFWQCMDTYRDSVLLNEMWNQENAPWKIWE